MEESVTWNMRINMEQRRISFGEAAPPAPTS